MTKDNSQQGYKPKIFSAPHTSVGLFLLPTTTFPKILIEVGF